MLYQNIRAQWRALALGILSLNLISPSIVKAQSKKPFPVRVAPMGQTPKIVAPVSAKAELVVQLSHGGGVTDVEFSPDNSLLASAGDDGAIKLWDTKTLELKHDLNSIEADMGDGPMIAFTPDGKQIISAGTYVKIWNLATGQPTTYMKAGGKVRSLALSPDGHLLALGWYQGLQVLNISGGVNRNIVSATKSVPLAKMLWSLKGQQFADKSLSLSRNGRLAIGLLNEVRVVDAHTGKLIQKFQPKSENISGIQDVARVAFRSDGSLAMNFGSLQLWSGTVGSSAKTLPIKDTEVVKHLEFSRNGQKLLIVGDDMANGRVRVFDANTLRIVTTIAPDMPDIASAAISANGKLVGNGVSFNVFAAQLWNGQTGKPISTWEGRNGGVNDVAVSTDLRYLATATDDGPLRIWNTTSQKISTMGNNMRGLRGVAFSPDGRRISNNRGEVWNVTTGKLERVLPTGAMAFMPEVPYVARKTKKPFMNGEKEDAELFDIALSPNGRLTAGAVTGMNDYELNAVSVWDTNSGALLHRLASDGWVHAVCFSRNGKVLMAGYGDGSIRFWNTTTWKLQQALPAHTGAINSLRLTPSGKQVLSAGNDYNVKIWDSTTGALQATLVILPPFNERKISKDWLLYTPHGYYDGSPGAEKWMRWRVGNQLYPASYGRSLRKSSLLKSVLQ